MNPLCPVCGHPVRVVGDAFEGTQHYEPVEAEARREGWDAALAAARQSMERPSPDTQSWTRSDYDLAVLDRLAAEGPR